jgi:hypothetical protein
MFGSTSSMNQGSNDDHEIDDDCVEEEDVLEIEVDLDDEIQDQHNASVYKKQRIRGENRGGIVWQYFHKTTPPTNAKKKQNGYYQCNYCDWKTCHATRAK